jgi:AcrR family transcriptional regulator
VPDTTGPKSRLINSAARILSEQGPSALSIRRVAADTGVSTMAIYTHFGSIGGLVAAVVDEAFARLAQHLSDVPEGSDPLERLLFLASAYRANAIENPHLFAAMFGSADLGRNPGDQLERGRETFDVLVSATRDAMDSGHFRRQDPESVAARLWCAVHGYVTLELAGFVRAGDEQEVFVPMLADLAVALRAD